MYFRVNFFSLGKILVFWISLPYIIIIDNFLFESVGLKVCLNFILIFIKISYYIYSKLIFFVNAKFVLYMANVDFVLDYISTMTVQENA